MRSVRRVLVLGATAVLAVGLVACGSGDDDSDDTTTSTTSTSTSSTTTTTAAAPASSTTSSTRAPTSPAAPTTTAAPLVPGDPCAVASDPNCIDPSDTGQGTYLEGGADCLAAFPDNPGLCEDLDGDGFAGYPDAG
jgi:hypothetical protein